MNEFHKLKVNVITLSNKTKRKNEKTFNLVWYSRSILSLKIQGNLLRVKYLLTEAYYFRWPLQYALFVALQSVSCCLSGMFYVIVFKSGVQCSKEYTKVLCTSHLNFFVWHKIHYEPQIYLISFLEQELIHKL